MDAIRQKWGQSVGADETRTLHIPQSDEYYLLKNQKWILLTNVENINYGAGSHWDRHFRYYMDTYAYEEHFFKIDSNSFLTRS